MADISSLVIMEGGNITTNQTLNECMTVFGSTNHLLAEKALAMGILIGYIAGILSLFIGALIYAKLQSNEPEV